MPLVNRLADAKSTTRNRIPVSLVRRTTLGVYGFITNHYIWQVRGSIAERLEYARSLTKLLEDWICFWEILETAGGKWFHALLPVALRRGSFTFWRSASTSNVEDANWHPRAARSSGTSLLDSPSGGTVCRGVDKQS